MNEVYLTIADGFEKLAAGYRALAGEAPTQETTPTAATPEATPTEAPIKQPTIEEVRAVLAAKSQAGHQMEVKNLLLKYDSGKLSGVKPEDYASLLADAEAL
jgi:hypothetical protein